MHLVQHGPIGDACISDSDVHASSGSVMVIPPTPPRVVSESQLSTTHLYNSRRCSHVTCKSRIWQRQAVRDEVVCIQRGEHVSGLADVDQASLSRDWYGVASRQFLATKWAGRYGQDTVLRSCTEKLRWVPCRGVQVSGVLQLHPSPVPKSKRRERQRCEPEQHPLGRFKE